MPANTSSTVTWFRGLVFLLALGFWFYQFTVTSLDQFGWQFRYLTIWGLTANVIVSWLMLRYSLGHSDKTHNSLVSAAVVVNAMVVFLYWKLWFTDPALVNSGGPLVWYQEYYLHGLGPALMAFDAFLILGVFRRFLPTFSMMLPIFVVYILWIEFAVSPRNIFPAGSATSGLPYPFLNDMAGNERAIFYATTIGTAIVFMLIGWGLAQLLARIHKPQTAT